MLTAALSFDSNEVAPDGSATALTIISDAVQPLSDCPEPNLKFELVRLEKNRDIHGMIALYDYFVGLAEINTAFMNKPRAQSIGDFLEAETGRIWAKAYLVADRLKSLAPTEHQRDAHARVLLGAAFAMGSTLKEVVALANHLDGRNR